MTKKTMMMRVFAGVSLCYISLHVQSADFFTIIGPDGRPMVVAREPKVTKDVNKAVVTPKRTQTANNSLGPTVIQTDPAALLRPTANDAKANLNIVPKPEIIAEKDKPQKIDRHEPTAQISHVTDNQVHTNTAMQSQLKQPQLKPAGVKQVEETVQPITTLAIEKSNNSHITELDGEKYVDNEYLEEKDFNLEGKQRFYVTPLGMIDSQQGIVRMQAEQREKGVTTPMFKELFPNKKKLQEEKTQALAVTYLRVPKVEIAKNLNLQCLSANEIKAAQFFNTKKQMGIWPNKPIKAQFDYELIQLSDPIQQLTLSSYAASVRKPTFYWPFVIFLDHKGCVIEGVTGYKNMDIPASKSRYAAIQGLLRLPDQTQYILLTPMASTVDVPEELLSNEGQIKLIAIR